MTFLLSLVFELQAVHPCTLLLLSYINVIGKWICKFQVWREFRDHPDTWLTESKGNWRSERLLNAQPVTNYNHACMTAQSLGYVWLSVSPWTVAHRAPLSIEVYRQEYNACQQIWSYDQSSDLSPLPQIKDDTETVKTVNILRKLAIKIINGN